MQYNISNNEQGFSLIELMVVLVIVGIMAGMAIPNIGGLMAGQEITEAAQNVAGALRSAKQTSISKNVRTQVWIIGDTTGGRSYTIYRQPMPGETLTSTDTVTVSGITLYAVTTQQISPKGQIGLQTKATVKPDGGAVSVKTSLQFNFKSTGTADCAQTGDTTIYLQPDKEFNTNKKDKMRAITVVNATGRVRIYQWGGSSWY